MPAESTILEQVKSCNSVSCLINMEPLELLRLQPSEPIASESVWFCLETLYDMKSCNLITEMAHFTDSFQMNRDLCDRIY